MKFSVADVPPGTFWFHTRTGARVRVLTSSHATIGIIYIDSMRRVSVSNRAFLENFKKETVKREWKEENRRQKEKKKPPRSISPDGGNDY